MIRTSRFHPGGAQAVVACGVSWGIKNFLKPLFYYARIREDQHQEVEFLSGDLDADRAER